MGLRVLGCAALALSTTYAVPLRGSDLTARDDGVEAKNEPCYAHDNACDGYPVCCVTIGTCISQHSGLVSSNTAYYEGGCQSFNSSKKEWTNPDCKQQGECAVQHLQVCKGGTTKPTFMTPLSSSTLARLMTGSCEADCPGIHYGHPTPEPGNTTNPSTRVSGTMELSLSAVDAVGDDAKLKLTLQLAVAALAGYGNDDSFTTVEMPTLASTFTLTYHLDVPVDHSVSADTAKANLAAATTAQKDEALAMYVGTCSYSLMMYEKQPETPGGFLGMPGWVWIVAGLAALVVLVLVALVVARSFSSKPASPDLEQELGQS